MALNLPGPTVTVLSISSTLVTVEFSNLPAGTTTHWLGWGRPTHAITLDGPADALNRLAVTVPYDKFITAAGFSYTAGGAIYGPGPMIAFTAPHDIFPNFEANNEAIQEILNQYLDKLNVDEFETYSGIVDGRLANIEADQKNIAVRIRELLAAITAARRKFLSP